MTIVCGGAGLECLHSMVVVKWRPKSRKSCRTRLELPGKGALLPRNAKKTPFSAYTPVTYLSWFYRVRKIEAHKRYNGEYVSTEPPLLSPLRRNFGVLSHFLTEYGERNRLKLLLKPIGLIIPVNLRFSRRTGNFAYGTSQTSLPLMMHAG